MTYKKPQDISYTDMCIYVDDNVYKEGFNEELIYQYIYHIVYMLAKQSQLFNKHHYYDDFAVFGANKVFLRLTNKKQWQYKEDGTPKLEKVKSVLNYIKNILYPLKVDFEQSEYCQTISKDSYNEEINYNFESLINSSLNRLTFCEFNLVLNNIDKTCKAFLKTIPYKTNSKEWLNIYTSVMLTFLNNVTLTNKRKRRLTHLDGTLRLHDGHILNSYNEEFNNKAILFHLPSSMSDYITVLARQLRHIVSKDLCDILHTNISNDIELIDNSVNDYMKDEEYNEY